MEGNNEDRRDCDNNCAPLRGIKERLDTFCKATKDTATKNFRLFLTLVAIVVAASASMHLNLSAHAQRQEQVDHAQEIKTETIKTKQNAVLDLWKEQKEINRNLQRSIHRIDNNLIEINTKLDNIEEKVD